VAISISNDPAVEPNETVNITLSNPRTVATGAFVPLAPAPGSCTNNECAANSGMLTPNSTATLTIQNDDFPGILQFSSPTYSFNEGAGNAVIMLTRNGGSSGSVGVTFSTSNGTAVAGSDYTTVSQTVSWANGDTTNKTVNVPINNDTLVETNETVNLTLSNPTGGATLGSPSTAVLTIIDNDRPSASINDVTINEGNSGTTSAVFTVSLTQTSTQTVTVTYSTANNTAVAGSDYVAQSGTLTFSPGQSTKTITVLVNGDSIPEANESFFVNLTSATNANILKGQGVATIINDDIAELANISTRGRVMTGDNIMIGGFIIEGSSPPGFLCGRGGHLWEVSRSIFQGF